MNRFTLPCYLTIVLAGLCAAPALAATPRDELLRLVPEDVGVCLIVQDLRGHTAAIEASPFAQQVRTSFVGKLLVVAPETKKLQEASKVLKEQFGTDWAQLRDDILGDAVVMTYTPGPPGEPDKEQGLFMVRARDAALLQKLIDKLNDAQKKSGDLKSLDEAMHNGVKYFKRVEKNHPPHWYLVRGPVLAYSAQEALLKRVIDLDKQAAAPSTPPAIAKHLDGLNVGKGLFTVWVNPRAFEADLEAKAKEAKDADAAALKNFIKYWKALDGVAISVAPEKSLDVQLALKVRTEALPASARKFFGEAAQASDLWNAFPPDALLAVAGRVDGPALLEMLGEFMTDDARKAMREALQNSPVPGLNKIGREVFPFLGPDIGFCIAAPPAQDKGWFPHMAWAIRVRPGKEDMPVEQTLMDGLNLFATLMVFDHNSKKPDRIAIKNEMQDKVDVRFLASDKLFPVGVRPAYALKAGYLLFTSSPEVVNRFEPKPAKEAPAGDALLMRASLVTLHGYLKERRETIAAFMVERHQVTKEEAGQRIDTWLGGLQFFQSVEVSQRSGPKHAVLTFRIKTTQPLRK